MNGWLTHGHFASWAWAGNTPFQWTKQVASHFGGTRNGVVLHWPRGTDARRGPLPDSSHVVDIAPTVLGACPATGPGSWGGQYPMDSISMVYPSTTPRPPGATVPVFPWMFLSRGIYP